MVEVSYYTGTVWETIENLVFPNQQTYGIDSGTDTMQVSFYANVTFDIPVETVVRIKYGEEYRYFIVKEHNYVDLQYPNLSDNKYQRLCTIQLVEPMEILKGFKVQACTFAQKRYTLQNVINKLCRLANFDRGRIDVINMKQYIQNRIDFPSTTLYLALFELARKYDSIPYLDFETGRWTIKFQRLDGLNETVYNGNEILTPFKQAQYNGEGLAKNVYIEATNVLTGGRAIKTFTPIATDGSSTININNFGLISQATIETIVRLVIIAEDETEWVISNSVNGTTITYQTGIEMNLYEQTRTFYIITKSAYDSLTSSQKQDYNNIYIYWENNIIYMHELEKMRPHFVGDFTNYWEAEDFLIFKEFGGIGYIHSPITGRVLWNNTFSILGQTLTANQIPFYAFNDSNYSNTVFYNQTAQKLDPITMSETLQSYIDNMQGGKYFRKGVFTSWNDIPKEGSVIDIDYKPYIVNSLSIIEYQTYYDVTFNLTQKHAQRREYMGADTTLQLNDMTNKDIVNSNNITVTKINYSMLEPIEVKNDLDVDIEQMGLVIPMKGSASLWTWQNTFKFEGKSVVISTNGSVDNFGNSLVFYAKALNNFVWDQEADESGNLVPINYCNRGGEVWGSEVRLLNENDQIMFQTKLIGSQALPIKDKHEVYTHTLQFIYKGLNNTIVRNEYVNHMLNTDYWEECTVLFYDTNIGQFDEKPSKHLELTGGIISINTVTQEIIISLNKSINVECKSIAVRGDSDILFIKNFNELTYVNIPLEIIIYYNIENPLPVRTGVKGYKY